MLASLMDVVIEKHLRITSWGQHIAPSIFNKFVTNSKFLEYVQLIKDMKGIHSLKQIWATST